MRRIPVFKKMEGIIKIDAYEGELIEDKVRRLTENKEPIKDSAPLVYTKKADGVLPQYNHLHFPKTMRFLHLHTYLTNSYKLALLFV